MQWHLLEPETSSECSRWSWHLCFLNGGPDNGGFPPDAVGTAGVKKIDDPCLPFETLPSPVMADDMNDEFEDTLKVSLENSSSIDFVLVLRMLGLVKSRVKLWD